MHLALSCDEKPNASHTPGITESHFILPVSFFLLTVLYAVYDEHDLFVHYRMPVLSRSGLCYLVSLFLLLFLVHCDSKSLSSVSTMCLQTAFDKSLIKKKNNSYMSIVLALNILEK